MQPEAAFNNDQALKEGWVLWDDGELQMLDEVNRFTSDDAAIAFVCKRAASGSAYHQSAIFIYTKTLQPKLSSATQILQRIYDHAKGIGGHSLETVTAWEIDTLTYKAIEDFLYSEPKEPTQ